MGRRGGGATRPDPARSVTITTTIDASARVHASADLEPDVSIGPGTAIWQRAQVRQGATLGSDCVIGRDAFIDTDVVIGDRVKIQNGALVYHGVTVGDGVFIGPGAILTNDLYPRAVTAEGKLARADDWVVTPTHLHDGCAIGAGAVVVAGNDIGRFATVGAGAIVTRPVPDHALVVGNPARRIGWVCRCGGRLNDDGRTQPETPTSTAAAATWSCARCARRYTLTDTTLEEVP